MNSKTLSILSNQELKKIIDDFDKIGSDKELFKYNIFSISKLGTQLEDFHSDIIYSLLNPKGLHNEGNIYLKLFLEFLSNKYLLKKTHLTNFDNAEVYREAGRLDISIIDYTSKKAIIFENKINNAPDMANQLDRYFIWCKDRGLEVVGIVYLSLRGFKLAPIMENGANVFNIGAFNNTSNDIVSGWLIPSIGVSKNIENTSLIIQYKKLLTFLGYKSMETELLNEFYELASDKKLIEKIDKLKELSDKIPEFRMDKLVKEIDDYKPFKKTYRYRNNHILFENFYENDNNFKIDIVFENSGSAFLHFWNPAKSGKYAFLSIKQKLVEIDYLNNFPTQNEDEIDENGWIGFRKYFDIKNYNTMQEIDEKIIDFTKKFMNELK
ncbi:PD-(D/E)XK nuclease family protein [Polaribacter aestuariivivens]|uniref:PD-(D/E)XK nuclease family protein n=1 Tax=Polaribacter aestuariivivens TaxID=2304626 RepID=UPI003F496745